ncbi:MGMT family protein [Cutibacterium acnes]|nr:MGMT family protein [Cutibacterium acnes]WKF09250.1 MGMT family protein [Cutibacterium acnes]
MPYGQTVSYRQLASIIGQPNASRAVGHACATNPCPSSFRATACYAVTAS